MHVASLNLTESHARGYDPADGDSTRAAAMSAIAEMTWKNGVCEPRASRRLDQTEPGTANRSLATGWATARALLQLLYFFRRHGLARASRDRPKRGHRDAVLVCAADLVAVKTWPIPHRADTWDAVHVSASVPAVAVDGRMRMRARPGAFSDSRRRRMRVARRLPPRTRPAATPCGMPFPGPACCRRGACRRRRRRCRSRRLGPGHCPALADAS